MSASNCPNCEFAKRGTGAPVDVGGGLWRCEECGNCWREIVAVARTQPARAPGTSEPVEPASGSRMGEARSHGAEAPTAKQAMAGTAGGAPADGEPEEARFADFSDTLALLRRTGRANRVPPSEAKSGYGAAGGVAFAAAAVLAGWFGMATVVSYWPAAGGGARASALELSVTNADRISEDGGSTVKVGGSITNRSRERQALDAVEIVLTDAGGGAMGSWRFHPALQYLEAGQTIHFSSAKGNVPALALGVQIRFASARQKIALGISPDAHRPQQEDRGAVQRRGNRPQES